MFGSAGPDRLLVGDDSIDACGGDLCVIDGEGFHPTDEMRNGDDILDGGAGVIRSTGAAAPIRASTASKSRAARSSRS